MRPRRRRWRSRHARAVHATEPGPVMRAPAPFRPVRPPASGRPSDRRAVSPAQQDRESSCDEKHEVCFANVSRTTSPRENRTPASTPATAAIISPYSTADAPLSFLRIGRSGVAVLGAGDAAADGTAGLAEGALDESAPAEHHADDDGGDGGDHQAVLDRGGATILGLAAHLAEVREHRGGSLQFLGGGRPVLRKCLVDTTVRRRGDPSRSVERWTPRRTPDAPFLHLAMRR